MYLMSHHFQVMPNSCSDDMCRFLSELVVYAPRRRKPMQEALSDSVFDEIKAGSIILPNGALFIPQPQTRGMISPFLFARQLLFVLL